VSVAAKRAVRRVLAPLREFLHAEASGGLVLLAATVAALVWANSPLAGSYNDLWHAKLTIGAGGLRISEDLQHWVNDGLMAVFFFVVGLEIKRELVVGELRDPRRAALPAVAAVGGVVLPALLFLALAHRGPEARGWGVPMATDIAFAVGVMAVLGARVSAGAKLFLLSLAIVDDIIAVLVIAVYYSEQVAVGWLAAGLVGLAATAGLVRLRLPGPLLYPLLGLVALAVWVAVLESGVHATIAGVALGFVIPARAVHGRSLLEQLEHRLHPVSSYGVVPIFALANAGVPLGAAALRTAVGSTAAWGIALGLVVGKPLGVVGASWAAMRLRLGTLPEDMTRRQLVGVGALAGIGFTVSLFIADLAYNPVPEVDANTAKVGILAASLVAGLLGALILAASRPEADQPDRRSSSP
jgi:Na+:H+ antiporter, NhaA family